MNKAVFRSTTCTYIVCFYVSYGSPDGHLYRFTISLPESLGMAASAAQATTTHQDQGQMMASKANSKSGTSKTSRANTLTVIAEKGISDERKMAELGQSPIVANANTARTFAQGSFGTINLNESISVLREKAAKVRTGDLSELEDTLTAQAGTLDAMFNELARRAALNMGTHLSATEIYLRMALKAQAQCRATIETLADVKYPKAPTFVRQQNVAYQQQVNNGGGLASGDNRSSTHTLAHAEQNQFEQNKLLKDQIHERTHLDAGTTTTASRSNPALEIVDALDRAEKRGG